MAVTFENAAELVKRLGNVPLARICMTPPPGTATVRDLIAAMRDSDRLYELVDGTLVEKTMGLSESMIASIVSRHVGTFAEEHDLGMSAGSDGTVRILKGLVRAPDVAFFCWEKLPGRMMPTKPVPDLAPDLAVEVLSRANTLGEMRRKLREYFLAGVRLVWIIDPVKRQASVYTASSTPDATLDESQTLDGGDVLPGFSLSLADVFARVPEVTQKRTARKKKS